MSDVAWNLIILSPATPLPYPQKSWLPDTESSHVITLMIFTIEVWFFFSENIPTV